MKFYVLFFALYYYSDQFNKELFCLFIKPSWLFIKPFGSDGNVRCTLPL